MSNIKNWDDVKKELKNKFKKLDAKLFDADEGDSEEFLAEIEKCYNITKAEAKEKFSTAINEFEKELSSIPQKIRNAGHKAGHNVEEFSNVAAEKVDEFIGGCSHLGTNAKAELEDGLSCLLNYVNKHPVKSLLAAVSAGVVLNKLLSSK